MKISIKKLLIVIMIITVIISIGVFSFVSIKYMDTYFNDYIEGLYDTNIVNIIDYSRLVVLEGKQQRMILNSYVVDPIYYAEIYDAEDNLIMNSAMMGNGGIMGNGGMMGNSSMMGNDFVFNEDTMVIESYELTDKGDVIGSVVIVRAKKTSYTNTKQIFTQAIYTGAVIAVISIFIIISLLGYIIVRYISNDTKKVVSYATEENAEEASSKIREFSQIVGAIKGYRAKLAVKEKVKKEKFDKVLHETKTPITVLKSQLEGAVDGLISIDKNRAADMTKEVDKLDDILKNATTIIEGHDIKENSNIVNVDYSSQIEKIINSLKTKFKNKNLSITYNKKPFMINTDIQILDSIIYNLLINSCKYTKEGGVTISASDNVLTIRDTGIGIKPHEIDKVFDLYFRGSNIKDIDGEGVGLYNVKSNLDLLGIDVKIDSKVNEYTEFKLIF